MSESRSCSVDMAASLGFTRAVWTPHDLQVTVELEAILKDRDGGPYQVRKGTSQQGCRPACASVTLCPLARMSRV